MIPRHKLLFKFVFFPCFNENQKLMELIINANFNTKNNRKKKTDHCLNFMKRLWTLAVNLCKRSTAWKTLLYLHRAMKPGMIPTCVISSGKNIFHFLFYFYFVSFMVLYQKVCSKIDANNMKINLNFSCSEILLHVLHYCTVWNVCIVCILWKWNNVFKLAFWWELFPQEQGKNEGNSEFAYCSGQTQLWENATNKSECCKYNVCKLVTWYKIN